MSISFDKASIVAAISEAQALADAIAAKKGSAQKRLADATLTALGHTVSVDLVDVPTMPKSAVSVSTTERDGEKVKVAAVQLGELSKFLVDITSWAEQMRNEAVKTVLDSQAGGDDVDALTTLFEAKVKMVKAMLEIAEQLSDEDVSDLAVPTLRRGRASSGGPSKGNTKRQLFYRVKTDGSRHNVGASQNTASSFAFYHGAAIVGSPGEGATNKGKGVPIDQLENFLKLNIEGFSWAKPWAIEADGVTYGMDVVDSGDDDTEEE